MGGKMKTQHEIVMISIFAMFLWVLGSQQTMAATDAATNDWPKDVVEAFKTDPDVQAEISRVRKRIKGKESTPEEFKLVILGGGCGVAGCSVGYLAVITVHRRGVNPQSSSVLAVVRRSPRGKLGPVSVVELKEKGLQDPTMEIQLRYSSPLPATERK
jgi:hypothetical protein